MLGAREPAARGGGGIGFPMSSVTPSRHNEDKSALIVGAIAGAAVLVILLGVVYGFAEAHWGAGIGHWFYATMFGSIVRYIVESLILLVGVLISTAILIYTERKIWGSVHLRRGPNVVGPWGTMQPFADFLKFILKEPIIPAGANKGVFLLAPLVGVVLAISAWAVIPVGDGWVISDINVGILYLFAVSSLGVYSIIMAGWASNSKYAFLA